MAVRKRTNTGRKTSTTAKSRRSSAANRQKDVGNLVNFVVPFVFIVGITFCLGFLLFMGYRTATASAFFDVKTIDVRGLNRGSKTEIENIVSRQATKTGVWNTDLAEIKSDIEQLTFVKSATVSRVLPDEVRVNIVEREPRAVVSLDSGEFWVDDEAVLLGKVESDDQRPPFVLKGWDETKSLKAFDENKERVKKYRQMLDEWQDFEVAKKVSVVDLSDLQDARAIVKDSGENVVVRLGVQDYGKGMRKVLQNIAGRGKEIKSAMFDGRNVVTEQRDG